MGRHRGFTLVELLVVIGIIALLISILLPVLGRVREHANNVKCLSNLKQMGVAAMTMATERRGYIQATSEKELLNRVDPSHQRYVWSSVVGNEADQFPKDWASALLPYLGDKTGQTFSQSKEKSKVFICPSDRYQNIDNPGYSMLVNYSWAYAPNSYGINADITSVVDPLNNKGHFNYGALVGVYGGPGRQYYNDVGGNNLIGQPLNAKLNKVHKPAETLLFADCGVRPAMGENGVPLANQFTGRNENGLNYSDCLAYSTNFASNNSAFDDTNRYLAGTLEGIAQTNWLKRKIAYDRHSRVDPKRLEAKGKINIVFCDGHAETVTRDGFKNVRVSPYNFELN